VASSGTPSSRATLVSDTLELTMDEQAFGREPRPATAGAASRLPWLVALLVALAVVLLLPPLVERIMYAIVRGRERAQVDVSRAQLPTPELAELSRQFSLVAKAIGPSVVHIDAVQVVSGPPGILARRSLGQYEALGQGSGVIVDEEGYILTNNHVVEKARAINVKLSGNETRPAEIVGLDDTTDLALLKIPSGGLIAAEWGDSDALQVGAPVWAVGNPFGLDRSVSFGIISAQNRRVFSDRSPYQVGHGHQGVSFSIPTSIAKDVYERLRESGRVVRGYMGVRLVDVTPEIAESLELKSAAGAVVAQVENDAPAARAGMEVEDVIVKWDGHEVANATELTMLVGKAAIGARVKVTVIRDGAPQELELTVEERPAQLGR
jgi:S1-C subfamily serine protease